MPLSTALLALHHSLVFIETGFYRGDGIQCALDVGFDCIYSADVSVFCHGWCSHRFEKELTKVHLHCGDSRDFLHELLPTITTQITFWLDAHFCGGDGGDPEDVPLLEELKVIARHSLKNHILLIDDVRLMGTLHLPVSQNRIIQQIQKMNRGYRIEYCDSPDFPNDILVAKVI